VNLLFDIVGRDYELNMKRLSMLHNKYIKFAPFGRRTLASQAPLMKGRYVAVSTPKENEICPLIKYSN
jgi:hypothetical protein